MTLVLPTAIAALLVHVTVDVTALQFQPAPLAEAYVKPDGSVSVTVIRPEVAIPPLLLTVIV